MYSMMKITMYLGLTGPDFATRIQLYVRSTKQDINLDPGHVELTLLHSPGLIQKWLQHGKQP